MTQQTKVPEVRLARKSAMRVLKRVYTLVNRDDFGLEKFLSRHSFVPSKRLNLEYKIP